MITSNDAISSQYLPVLKNQGYEVHLSKSGAEGLEVIYQRYPDVVITDLHLPDMNGHQLSRVIKHDPVIKNISIIMITSTGEKLDKFWGIRSGSDSVLTPEELDTKLIKQIELVKNLYQQSTEQIKYYPCDAKSRLNHLLDKTLIETTIRNEFKKLSELVHDPDLTNYMMFSFMEDIIDYDVAGVLYRNDAVQNQCLSIHIPESTDCAMEDLDELKSVIQNHLKEVQFTLNQSEELELDIIGKLPESLNEEGTENPVKASGNYFKTIFTHPFFIDNVFAGVFLIASKSVHHYETTFPVPMVLDELKLLMKLRSLYAKIHWLNITDNLTKVYNYSYFIESLEHEFKLSARYNHPLCVILVQISNFQDLNDKFGAKIGDQVLKELSECVQASLRDVDFVGRFSSKELMICLPKTPTKGAEIASERLLEKVNALNIEFEGESVHLGVVTGIATLEEDTPSVKELIQAARNSLL